MTLFHYLNGEIVPESGLAISPRDLGLTRGFAVFEFFRTYRGRPFLLEKHMRRLLSSAERIGLRHPWSHDALSAIVHKTIGENEPSRDYALRMIVTGGPSPMLTPTGAPTVVVIVDNAIEFPASLYQFGQKAITISYQRQLPVAKTTNYLAAVRALSSIQDAIRTELIYLDEDGLVLEGAASNIFAVIDGQARTPANRVLEGMTRGILLENLPKQAVISDVSYVDLVAADEIFITTSGKGVVPIVEIDGNVVSLGEVGPVTKACIAAYSDFVASDTW